MFTTYGPTGKPIQTAPVSEMLSVINDECVGGTVSVGCPDRLVAQFHEGLLILAP
jgi:hypothetical protein